MTKLKNTTPWGPAQDAKQIAPGIVFYSTAGHGGFYLDSERNDLVHDEFKTHITFADLRRQGWYEEDCDAAIVIFTFPEFFTPDEYLRAVESLRNWHKDAWKAIASA